MEVNSDWMYINRMIRQYYEFTEGPGDQWRCDCVCNDVSGFGRAGSKTAAKKKAAFMVLVLLLKAAGCCKDEWLDQMYESVVYDLKEKGANDKRMQRWRENLNVIFDMDGVIFDSERFYIECNVIAAKKVGLDRMEQTAYQCIGITEKETERKLWQEYGADAPVEEFLQESRRIFKERYNEFGLPLKEGVVELLQFLQENHAKVAIASSTEVNSVKTELRDAGLIDYFDVIVGGNMVAASKPAPDIFLRAAKDLQRDIKDCYIIEDSFNGVRAARKAGGNVFMVPDILQPTEEIRMLTDRVFGSLTEVREYFEGI